jgi:hypothetical protein
MLPEKLIADFWVEVLLDLVSRHQLSGKDAAEAVQSYRLKLDDRGIGDLIYHRNSDSVADTVADGWKSGFLTPSAVTP